MGFRRSRLTLAIFGALAASLGGSLAAAASVTPAGTPTLWGWATVRNATASYKLQAADHATSAGRAVLVHHLDTGQYRVVFNGLGNDGGNVQVAALANSRKVCEVFGYSRASVATNLQVSIDCYLPNGLTADSPFTVSYISATGDAGKLAYLYASGLGSETPDAQYFFNSSGGTADVNRQGTGTYQVTLDGLATSGGHVEVSVLKGTHTPVHCVVEWWTNVSANEVAEISCYNRNGTSVDTPFLLLFTNREGMMGHGVGQTAYLWADQASEVHYVPDATYRYSSAGRAPAITRTSAGRYEVVLPGMPSGGAVQVTTYGTGDSICHPITVRRNATPQIVNVRCDSPSGTPQNSQFVLLYEH
jgi:hypothetical protein